MEQASLAGDLKSVADSEDGAATVSERLHLAHDGREARHRARAQVIAVGEASREDHDVGIFAFANRTYAGPAGMVWDIAMELQKEGWLTSRAIPVSAALAQLFRTAQSMFTAGRIDPGRGSLAPNFLTWIIHE